MAESVKIEYLAGVYKDCIVVDGIVKRVEVTVEQEALYGDSSRMEIELEANDSPVREVSMEPAIPLEKGDAVRLYFA